jgi:hypothetical protein
MSSTRSHEEWKERFIHICFACVSYISRAFHIFRVRAERKKNLVMKGLNKHETAKKDNDVVTIPNKNHCFSIFYLRKIFRFDYTSDER